VRLQERATNANKLKAVKKMRPLPKSEARNPEAQRKAENWTNAHQDPSVFFRISAFGFRLLSTIR
jgi:hypothetical protein